MTLCSVRFCRRMKTCDAKVKEAIAKSLWRKEYMTYKEHMDQEYNRGLEEGREEGREEIRISFYSLVQDGLLSVEEASRRVNMTLEDFQAGFNAYIDSNKASK